MQPKLPIAIAITLSFAALACRSTTHQAVVSADPVVREELLGAVSGLAGRWQATDPEGEPKFTEFAVIAGGSAVREIMLPGEDHEMTNMYTLDGNSLVMTHYCAGGNQPRMRATEVVDGHVEFRAESVADLASADEIYMGAMTLEIVSDDRVIQHWKALKGGALEEEMVIEMTRVD